MKKRWPNAWLDCSDRNGGTPNLCSTLRRLHLRLVAIIATLLLTSVPISDTSRESRSSRDAFGRGYSRKRSECGARARKDTVRSRAASGIMLTGTTTGPGGAFPGLGQAGAGNARVGARGLRPPVGAGLQDRALLPRPRKPGLELRPRGESPDGESRGGTPTGERVPHGRAPHR